MVKMPTDEFNRTAEIGKETDEIREKNYNNIISNNVLFLFTLLFVILSVFNFWSIYHSIPYEGVSAQATTSIVKLCVGRPSSASFLYPANWEILNGSERLTASATNPAGNEHVKNVTFRYAIEGGPITFISTDMNDGDTVYNITWDTTTVSDGNCVYMLTAEAKSECEPAYASLYYLSINNVDEPPTWNNYKNSMTTNFSQLSSWARVVNATIGKPHLGLINFSGIYVNFDNANIDANVNISRNNISIKNGIERCLNRAAILTLYNLSYVSPKIMRNNEECPASVCRFIRYEDGNLTFSVTDFGYGLTTRYYAAENTTAVLKIFDDTDNYKRYYKQDIKFYANFTTANKIILNGSDVFCEISFNLTGNFTTPTNMSFNPYSLYYEYNRSFNRTGTFLWRVFCNAEAREFGTIEKLDAFTITNRPPVLISQIPNQTWLENALLTGLDLDDYFIDPDEQELWYNNSYVSDITVEINDSTVTFIPRRYWYGNRTVVFYAHDPYNLSAESNEVELVVLHLPPPPPPTATGAYPGPEPCLPNWSCTEFGPCLYTNITIRTCFDTNFCDDNRTRPEEFRRCWYIPSCYDLIRNQDEEGVDCGGSCPTCPTCYDLIRNQNEEGVDCGGPCLPCPSCNDGIRNQGEAGIDCGGPCKPCSFIEMPAAIVRRTRNLFLIVIIFSLLLILILNRKRAERGLRKLFLSIAAKKKKGELIIEEEQIRERALRKLELLAAHIKKRPASESAMELSFIMRVFFKELFKLHYEFTGREFTEEIKKTAIDKNMKVLVVSFFSKIEQMEFGRFRIKKHELFKMSVQARTIVIALTKELLELRREEKIQDRGKRPGSGGNSRGGKRQTFLTMTLKHIFRQVSMLFSLRSIFQSTSPFSSTSAKERSKEGSAGSAATDTTNTDMTKIENLLSKGEFLINKDRIRDAIDEYRKILAFYRRIPAEEKEKIHGRIIRFFRRLEAELNRGNIKGKLVRKKPEQILGKKQVFTTNRNMSRIMLLLLILFFTLVIPKIFPSLLPFLPKGIQITGYGFVCTGDICFDPIPPDITTYQGNETVAYVNVTNPNNVSINFTTTADNPLFKSVTTVNKTTGMINFTPTNDKVGSYIVQIAVYNVNTGALEDLKEPNYTVLNINDPPNITSWHPSENSPNVSENYSIGFEFNYTASDPDIIYGDVLSSFWYLDSQLNSTNQTIFNYYTDFCSAGYHNVTVIVQDIEGLTDMHYWNVNVTNVNRVPVLNRTINNYSWNEDSFITNAFDLDEYFYDLDNMLCNGSNRDNITYTATRASGGAPSANISINSITHVVSFSAPENWCGQEAIVFVANDSINSTQSNTVYLNVSCVPDAPLLAGIGDKEARADVNLIMWINATDADIDYGDLLTFAVNDTSLFTITTTNQTAATGIINFTPSFEQVGTYYFNISVTDTDGLQDFEFITFTISPNQAPLLEQIANQSKYQNESFTMQLNASDPDGDNITYSHTTTNFPSFSISSTGLMSFSFVQRDVGNHSVTVYVTDSWGAINSSTFDFEVKDVNAAPALSSIADKRAKINRTFTLFIDATDEDVGYGDSLTFAINDTALFNMSQYNENTTLINFTPTEAQIGDYYYMVNATDSKGMFDNKSFKLTIDRNAAPIITINALNATETENFVLDMTAYTVDLDNDPLIYSYLLVNETNATFPSFNMTASGIMAFTPNKLDVGNHTLNVIVSDGENSTSKIISFTVFEIDNPPVLSQIGNQTAYENVLFTLQLNASDIENDTLEFVYEIINTTFPNFYMSSSGLINFTPKQIDVGNHTINITVREVLNNSKSDSEIIIFRVLHINNPPNITSYMPPYANLSIYENQSITFNHTSEDIDNDTLYYKWFIDSVLQTTSQNWTYSPTFDAAGLHNITLIVNDSFNITMQSWNVTVINVNRPPFYGVYSESYSGFANGTFNHTNLTSGVQLANNASYYSHGFFTSQIIDFNAFNTNYPQINLSRINYTTTTQNNTSVAIGIRTSEDGISWSNWSYYSQSGSTINGTSNRYLQYMLNLSTTDTNQTPIVSSISIDYAISNMSFPQNVNPWWIYLNHFFKDLDNENLTYNYSIISGSSILSITISGQRVQLKPTDHGTAIIRFNATDPYNATAESNTILLNIEKVESTVPIQVIGGGGAASTIIKEKTKETPYSLNIIVPEPITMYKNDTVVAPVRIVNNGNLTLENIRLYAVSENKNLKLTLTTDKIDKLAKEEEIKTTLIIESYQTYGSYEVIIIASVEKPRFNESNKLFVNSIELGSEDERQLNTKIAYTQDLLAENPECLELNEFLSEAKTALEKKQYEKTTQLLDSIIRSCKYLITEKKRVYEKPARVSFFLNKNLVMGTGVIVTVLILLMVIYRYIKKRFG